MILSADRSPRKSSLCRLAGIGLFGLTVGLACASAAGAAIYIYDNTAVGTTTIPETTVANCICQRAPGHLHGSRHVQRNRRHRHRGDRIGRPIPIANDDSRHSEGAQHLDTAHGPDRSRQRRGSPDNYDVVISTYSWVALTTATPIRRPLPTTIASPTPGRPLPSATFPATRRTGPGVCSSAMSTSTASRELSSPLG